MQVYYNEENITKNYLSAYVKYFVDDSSILFVNTLYDTKFELCTSNNNIEQLIDSLKLGIDTDDLLMILKNITNKYEELYVNLLQSSVIE